MAELTAPGSGARRNWIVFATTAGAARGAALLLRVLAWRQRRLA